ncbi:uncharacterized protein [Fopius arisanus]|uniref:Odorant receptor n=1 Tax=Fopius arisanus TaxID=64838 RepID=A0A9R1U3H0_9HYME|nr:PREDICTED: uncharacterized protein LOC105268144 [Fopius arisanus]
MDRRKLPELAIAYVKIGTTLLCTWPLTSGATNLQRKFNQVKWLSLLLLLCSLEFSILYTAYLSRANFMELTRFICFAASSGHAIIKMIVCRWHQQEYRELIEEMEIFLTYATCREREVLDVCVRKAAPVHLTFNIIGLVAGISYICGPIILDQNLPTETVYPFATDHYPALQIIYLMQSISVLQCCTVGPLDGQVCMPFWFNIARLKLLASDMRKISGVDDLNACIKVHQDILRSQNLFYFSR